LRAVDPSRLLVTHAGAFDDVDEHLALLDERLDDFVRLVAQWQSEGLERDAIAERLAAWSAAIIAARGEQPMPTGVAQFVTPFAMSVDGVLRYLRRRQS
jgi:hypothetical protein